MTRDEILNMPAGAEMNALIAGEIMCWAVNGNVYVTETITMTEAWQPIPDFSGDVGIVWQAVEKMRERSIGVTVSTVGPRNQTYAYCTLDGKTISKAWANAASLAVCHAILLTTVI